MLGFIFFIFIIAAIGRSIFFRPWGMWHRRPPMGPGGFGGGFGGPMGHGPGGFGGGPMGHGRGHGPGRF